MATSCVSVESQDDKLRLQEVDESLRKKYLDIVMSRDISELRIFSKQKYRYKKLVMSDMFEGLNNKPWTMQLSMSQTC